MVAGCTGGAGLARPALLTRLAVVVVWLAVMAGCSNAVRWTPEYHTVREGETLYAIAWRYGLDQRQLASWNKLGTGSLIYPGQKLKLTGPNATAATPSSQAGGSPGRPAQSRPATPPPVTSAQRVSDWRWPTAGPLVAAYGASAKTASGIEIGGQLGQPVLAAAAGEVVYAGSGLKTYGQLVIIKHNPTFLSAYGYNQSLMVAEGDRVVSGQPIAKMGHGSGNRPLLHFEIRLNGKPVNPLGYLPAP